MKTLSFGRRVFFFLIGMLFGGVGLYMVSRGLSDVAGGLRSNSWASAEGTIEDSRVLAIGHPRGGTSYRPATTFRYRVGQTDHRSGRIRFGDSPETPSRGLADQWVARHPVGSAVTISYDPSHPSEAVIEPGVRISALLLPAAGSLFLLVGLVPVGVAIGLIKGGRQSAEGWPPKLEILSLDGRQIVFRRRPPLQVGLAVAGFGLLIGVIGLAVGLNAWPAIQWCPMALPLVISGLILWLASWISAVRETVIDAPTRSLTITLSLRGWSRSTRYPLDRYGVVRSETLIVKGRNPDGSTRDANTTHRIELRAHDVALGPGQIPGPGPFHLVTADTPEQAREITHLVSELLGFKQVDAGARVLGRN